MNFFSSPWCAKNGLGTVFEKHGLYKANTETLKIPEGLNKPFYGVAVNLTKFCRRI